jgi:signal transduction histidine kinase
VAIVVSRLDEATVNGDVHRLQQLLLNVLDNALRVSPAQGNVTVELTLAAGQTSISIRDEGPGIDPDQLTRIFDRLYSRPARGDERAGAGLGLSIARAIAHTHNGELSAHNNRHRGATFTLTLSATSDERHMISL